MPRKQSLEDLSADELRWLLLEKRRALRLERLERFRRTGRVVSVVSDTTSPSLESWRTGTLAEEPAPASSLRSRGKRFLDSFLLIIEISGVIGFLFVLYNGLSLIQELNREVASALGQPTLTATPLIVSVVLPSGHTSPSSPGGAKFNDAEIPDHLRPLVQSLTTIPLPTPSPEQAIRIQIPGIKVDAPVVQGDAWEQLKMGVGQHLGSANPGEKGNIVFSAHNDIFGEIFRHLDRLKPGDLITIYTSKHSYTYSVVDRQIVEPTEVEVMGPASQPTLTLISCYPYLIDNKRIVVTARLLDAGN